MEAPGNPRPPKAESNLLDPQEIARLQAMSGKPVGRIRKPGSKKKKQKGEKNQGDDE